MTIKYGALKKPCESGMCERLFLGCASLKHVVLPCYYDYNTHDWFDDAVTPEIVVLGDSTGMIAPKSPEEMAALAEKVKLEIWAKEHRKRILSNIQEDLSAGRTIAISELSKRAQKQALACGFSLTDSVTYQHKASSVMYCPCAMQSPALERVSVAVPRAMLSEGESDCVLVYLDEKRKKNWVVLPTGEVDEGVEKYASADEAKASRFGALVPIISSARTIGKKC